MEDEKKLLNYGAFWSTNIKHKFAWNCWQEICQKKKLRQYRKITFWEIVSYLWSMWTEDNGPMTGSSLLIVCLGLGWVITRRKPWCVEIFPLKGCSNCLSPMPWKGSILVSHEGQGPALAYNSTGRLDIVQFHTWLCSWVNWADSSWLQDLYKGCRHEEGGRDICQ